MRKATRIGLMLGIPMSTIPWILLLVTEGWPIPRYQIATPFPYLMTVFAFLCGMWLACSWERRGML